MIHFTGLFFIWFLLIGRLSSEPIYLKDITDNREYIKNVYYLEDPKNSFLISDILEDSNFTFKKIDKNFINFYITKSSYWLKLEIENNSNSSDWWIEVANGNIDDIRFYFYTDAWSEIRGGDEQVDKNLPEDTNFQIFPLHLNVFEKKIFYIKVSGHEMIELPLTISRGKDIKSNISLRYYILGLYIGSMIAFFIYNFILFISLKEKVFGYYSLYILSGLAVFTYVNGSFPNFGIFKFFILYPNLLIIFSSICSIIFTMEFLKTKLNTPLMHSILKLFIYLFISLIPMVLVVDKHFSSIFVYIVSIFIVGVFIFTGFLSISNNDGKRNKLYIISWLLFYFGIIIQILHSSGIVISNIVTIYTIPFGNTISVILISISLAEKIQGYQTREIEANLLSEKTISESKKFLDEHTSNLEVKITERTKSIYNQKLILEEKNKNLEREITMAGKLQSSLMPQKDKTFKNLRYDYLYKPMMGVGGDFIDIREGKKSTHIGVFICDISGHGIVASLIASMVKISLQYWENTLTKPASVSELVLKNLSGTLDRNFLTAIIGFMNTRTGEFKFANAGHPPLAFLPKNKDSVLLNARGKMIVEIMKPNCEEKLIQLEDGDKIVLYTDGITETRSLEGEMIGEEVFLKFLDSIKSKTPEEIVKLVSKYLDTYSSNTPMEDDCTMLVFEFYREKD
jgi:serine phosphatase RsbU (regulator of sigma subunit)